MSIYPHRHDAKARVYTDAQGIKWVTHAELLENEYESLEDFTIVYLNGKFYELQGFSNAAEAWWIEEVETPEDEAPDADAQTEA